MADAAHDDDESRVAVFRPAAARAANTPALPGPPVRRIKLATPEQIAQQMRKIFRQAAAGEITAMQAKRMASVLKDLADLHKTSELQGRLDTIEQLLTRRRSR